jgi:outer membrane protein, heavy metal efflux system
MKMTWLIAQVWAICLLGLISISGYTQQRIELNACEQLFIKQNLQLLAQQFNVDAERAKVVQAKIWANPYVSGELNVYSTERNEYFQLGQTGQKSFAIEQLLYMGGKKKHEIAFALSNVHLAELQFQQLLLNLKRNLYANFYGLYFDIENLNIISSQTLQLDSLLQEYFTQANKGNVSFKELSRLSALAMQLKNDKFKLETNILQQQQALQLLTGLRELPIPNVNPTHFQTYFLNKKVLIQDSLWRLVKTYNPEFASYQASILLGKNYQNWQKSLAIPDLTIGVSYDQRGGAFQNQYNLTFGMPLPIKNSNKGNILEAKSRLDAAQTNQSYLEQELNYKLLFTLQSLNLLGEQLDFIQSPYQMPLTPMMEGVMNNFRKRNLSLLEFTDLIESYNTNIQMQNNIKRDYILSCLEVNFLTNSPIF